MNTKFETNFVVMPADCNYLYPMIFGGAFFSKMDLAAACCASRLLHDSECDSAVTHKYEGTFHKPTYAGDIIALVAEVVELRKKAIVVEVKAYREKHAKRGVDFVAEGKFVFVSRKGEAYHDHGLSLEQ